MRRREEVRGGEEERGGEKGGPRFLDFPLNNFGNGQSARFILLMALPPPTSRGQVGLGVGGWEEGPPWLPRERSPFGRARHITAGVERDKEVCSR